MRARRRFGLALGVVVAVASAGTRAGAQVGYTLDVTTEYLFGVPAGATFLGGGSPSPDTGSFVITNNGTSTFTGSIGDLAVSPSGDDSFTALGVTLAPGQSVAIAIGNESSNQGGYNKQGGANPDLGVQILLTGTVSNGGSEAVSLSVYDSDIHSGVLQTNPFGVLLDNYVLQGGDPFGRDTTDGYETTQPFGHFEFFERGAVPEPSTIGLAAFGAALCLARRLRLRRRAVA